MHDPPKICFLSSQHPPFDKRVFQKEAVSLAAAGFQVVHLCPNESVGQQIVKGVEVVSYPRRTGKIGRLLGLSDLLRRAREVDADAYHCNEPDSLAVGILVRLLDRRLLIFDCHEHYPGQITRWLPPRWKKTGSWLTRYVLQVLGLFTHLNVLAKYSVASDLSWSASRHLVVLNTTPVAALAEEDGDPSLGAPGDGLFRFVHIGLIGRERGTDELLGALQELKARGRDDLRVVIIGEFVGGTEGEFLSQAAALGVRDLVDLHPWLPFPEAFALVRRADTGLILFQPNLENNVKGMPHKMFDYMLAGIPVIAPNFAPDIVAVLEDAGGVLIDTSSTTALADAMQTLMDNREWAVTLGRRGQAAVFEKYNWENESEKLIEAYGRLFWSRG